MANHEQELSSPLPPDLVQFLHNREYACLTHATDKGTAFIIKAPSYDIESVRGRVPIYLSHKLYAHPAAPVIRILLVIYDQPDRPLALETFINVEDPQQEADFERLTKQEESYLLFYDELLQHRLTKGIRLGEPEPLVEVLKQAKRLLAAIPKDQFSFEKAKEAVLTKTEL